MNAAPVRIVRLIDRGDTRGQSFAVPGESLEFLGRVRDVHITSLLSGMVRGNHYHEGKREVLIVVFSGRWSFHWDTGGGTLVNVREFKGSGAVAIEIEPRCSHAVRNDGEAPLVIAGFSSEPYSPSDPDSVARAVVG